MSNDKAKQEAERLIESFAKEVGYLGRKAAIICVKEILNNDVWHNPHDTEKGKLFYDDVLSHLKNMQ